MNNKKSIETESNMRQEFISQLSEAFLATKGYGIYAYLNPVDVNDLFNQYIDLDISAKDFARKFVKSK
ncbi:MULTISPECIES: hypothetical protein [unclassified Methylobacter]|jgi:hypothetical protein|uniref:hypothetical protein n=1 Tax=unclassified Methylobacter TaxID=2635283 RepID=UPI0018935D22|nr:hypothetical protein [Methylobacter sp. BlB1]MBF6649424.1 hypothetical protein [Methylobacter sp. BlB1]